MGQFLDRMVAELTKDREKHSRDDSELNRIAGITDNVNQSDGQWIADLGLNNPKIVEILRALQGNLLLVDPVLRFVQMKQSEIARATLVALYGQEEFDRMATQELENQKATELVG